MLTFSGVPSESYATKLVETLSPVGLLVTLSANARPGVLAELLKADPVRASAFSLPTLPVICRRSELGGSPAAVAAARAAPAAGVTVASSVIPCAKNALRSATVLVGVMSNVRGGRLRPPRLPASVSVLGANSAVAVSFGLRRSTSAVAAVGDA